MVSTKAPQHVDEYSFSGTDYVTVKTRDGWTYRFMRPEEHQPYVFDMKQRPDGTRHNIPDTETPTPVVEYMEQHYDCAQLHPERLRSGDARWSDA